MKMTYTAFLSAMMIGVFWAIPFAAHSIDVGEEFCVCEGTAGLAIPDDIVLDDTVPVVRGEQESQSEIELKGAGGGDFSWQLLIPVLAAAHYKECGKREDGQWVIYLDRVIRVGDDINFNENHMPMSFCISSAHNHVYVGTFIIPEQCHYSAATLKYFATGVYGDNKIYINGKLVDTTCHTGNIAGRGRCCTNGDRPVTNAVHMGTNTIRIETVLFPGDEVTPYDDIELYNMHVSLTPQ